jgi:hypothetical protein
MGGIQKRVQSGCGYRWKGTQEYLRKKGLIELNKTTRTDSHKRGNP